MKSGKLLLVATLFILSGFCVTTAIAANPLPVQVTAQDLPGLPLYPGAFYYEKQARVQSLGTNGKGRIYRVKFLTRDDVKRVYSFYTGELQRYRFSFLPGATAESFKATSQARKMIVKVDYRSLEDPDKGTNVSVAMCIGGKTAPTDIGVGLPRWLPPGVLKAWRGK